MKTTTLEMFREELLKDGTYETPPERRAPKRRPMGWWTTVSFTWGPFSVFPKCAIYEALGILNTDRWAHFCFRAAQKAEQFGMKITLDGWKNRTAHDGPVVYLCNHMSTLETMALPPMLIPFGKISIILKKSIDQIPLIGSAMRTGGDIAVTRTNPREDLKTVFREGCDRISRGYSIVIFPQGTRSAVFDRRHFSSLGVKLAEKAQVPVVPIACQTDFLAKGKPGLFEDFGAVDPSKPIRFACGPVLPSGLGAKAMQEQSIEFIVGKLTEWGLPVKQLDGTGGEAAG